MYHVASGCECEKVDACRTCLLQHPCQSVYRRSGREYVIYKESVFDTKALNNQMPFDSAPKTGDFCCLWCIV